MSLTEPSLRRLRPIRLTDIPLQVRYRAAQQEARHAHTPEEAKALLAAALSPSDTLYWIRAA